MGISLSIICFTSQSNKVASIVTELVDDNGWESCCFNAHFLYAISISSLQLPARFPFSTYRSWTSQTRFRVSSTCLSRIRTISCLKYTGNVINPVPIYKNLYVSHLGFFFLEFFIVFTEKAWFHKQRNSIQFSILLLTIDLLGSHVIVQFPYLYMGSLPPKIIWLEVDMFSPESQGL